jgi:hypothetical protein
LVFAPLTGALYRRGGLFYAVINNAGFGGYRSPSTEAFGAIARYSAFSVKRRAWIGKQRLYGRLMAIRVGLAS